MLRCGRGADYSARGNRGGSRLRRPVKMPDISIYQEILPYAWRRRKEKSRGWGRNERQASRQRLGQLSAYPTVTLVKARMRTDASEHFWRDYAGCESCGLLPRISISPEPSADSSWISLEVSPMEIVDQRCCGLMQLCGRKRIRLLQQVRMCEGFSCFNN